MNTSSLPTNSYNNISKDNMPDRWLYKNEYQIAKRLIFIKSIQAHTPSTCPECHADLEYEEDGEVYCPDCGLVVCDNYPYTAGILLVYPYGLRLG